MLTSSPSHRPPGAAQSRADIAPVWPKLPGKHDTHKQCKRRVAIPRKSAHDAATRYVGEYECPLCPFRPAMR